MCDTYLNLQNIITIKTLVVHLMIGIICITATLILYESEPTLVLTASVVGLKGSQDIDLQTTGGSPGSGDVATDETTISVGHHISLDLRLRG